MTREPVAIVGSGNIGTDLMYKLLRSTTLEPRAMVGIDPASDGLRRAHEHGLATTHDGVEWLIERASEFRLVFEATSAAIHARHAPLYGQAGLACVDLTPAAVGPAVVPSVNLGAHLDEPNVNMITCGGQATVPIVAAVAGVSLVPYAEIVSAVASRSAGPGTRKNIDEFTRTTARSLVEIGGARAGKAIIILNPAEPPILMRNTIFCALPSGADWAAIEGAVRSMVGQVARYVPGYRLKQDLVFEAKDAITPGGPAAGRVTVLLEVSGRADYLPAWAGNLDIMTAAAVQAAEVLIAGRTREAVS